MTRTKISSTITNLMVIVAVSCAVTMTVTVLRRAPNTTEVTQPRETASPGAQEITDWTALASEGHDLGPEDASVWIVVFSDFQCPACRALATRLRALNSRHPTRARVFFRHFPLASHVHAQEAALASECAGTQGRFLAFHDALFGEQDVIGQMPWRYFGGLANLPDIPAFVECIREGEAMTRIVDDRRRGELIGVDRTPTWIINGTVVVGVPSLSRIEEMVALHSMPAVE